MSYKNVDTVWFVYQNKIYKGLLLEQVHIEKEDDYEYYYNVQTHFGIQVKLASELYSTREQLVDAITSYLC